VLSEAPLFREARPSVAGSGPSQRPSTWSTIVARAGRWSENCTRRHNRPKHDNQVVVFNQPPSM
jgi:hypothetical protein